MYANLTISTIVFVYIWRNHLYGNQLGHYDVTVSIVSK